MRKLVLVGVLVALGVLAGCSSQAPGSSMSASSSVNSSSSASSSSAAVQADVVTIGLDYSAGTGFEWTCSDDPAGIVETVGQTTESKSSEKNISGGPLQERFTFRAVKPGEVVLTFKLARSWESGDPAETQTYAFTVSDDLKMVLNPYKSDFTNEPEWGI